MEIVRTKDVGYEAAARAAARALSLGGIVLYPTDTLYGLGVDARNTDALQALYTLKKRDAHKTALVVVPSIAVIEEIGVVNECATSLIERFLPGALTLVLSAKEGTLKEIIRDDGTVGIRMPNDPFCLVLNQAFSAPYTSTSANLSGMPTEATVADILLQFGSASEAIALVIDDGPRSGGLPSTIVSCVSSVPCILREGAIPAHLILT